MTANTCEVCGTEIPEFHATGHKRRFCSEHGYRADVIVSVGESEPTAKITAVTKLRHAELWEAARKLGSQAKLADALGVHQHSINAYCGLRNYPRVFPGKNRWPKEKEDSFRAALIKVTGKTAEELWPEAMREQVWLSAKKTIEQTREIEHHALLMYCQNKDNNDTEKKIQLEAAVDAVLRTLPPRDRVAIARHFGIGCQPQTFKEIGNYLKVSGTRARDRVQQGIRKLNESGQSRILAEAARLEIDSDD